MPGVELRIDAARQPLGERRRRPAAAPARSPSTSGGKRRHRLGKVRGQRPAGLKEHLERAHEALAIARQDARRRRRIDPLHHAPEKLARRGGPAIALEPLRGARRPCPDPETARASARDSRSPVPPTRIGTRPRAWMSAITRRRVARVIGRRVFVRRIDDVDQMMRDAALLRRAAPCRCRCRSRDTPPSSRS